MIKVELNTSNTVQYKHQMNTSVVFCRIFFFVAKIAVSDSCYSGMLHVLCKLTRRLR